jgi:hypothetical protein
MRQASPKPIAEEQAKAIEAQTRCATGEPQSEHPEALRIDEYDRIAPKLTKSGTHVRSDMSSVTLWRIARTADGKPLLGGYRT